MGKENNSINENLKWLNDHGFYKRELSDVDIFVQGKVISFDRLSPYFMIDYKNKKMLNYGMTAFLSWEKYLQNIEDFAKREYDIDIEKITSISWDYAIIHYEEELLKILAEERK